MICRETNRIYNLVSQIEREIGTCTDENTKRNLTVIVYQLYEICDRIQIQVDCED